MTADGLMHFERVIRDKQGQAKKVRLAVPINHISLFGDDGSGYAEVHLINGTTVVTDDLYDDVIELYRLAVLPEEEEDDENEWPDDELSVIDPDAVDRERESWRKERDRLLNPVTMTGFEPPKASPSEWDDIATATPIADLKAAQEQLRTNEASVVMPAPIVRDVKVMPDPYRPAAVIPEFVETIARKAPFSKK